jgi:hypothetical protein
MTNLFDGSVVDIHIGFSTFFIARGYDSAIHALVSTWYYVIDTEIRFKIWLNERDGRRIPSGVRILNRCVHRRQQSHTAK